MYKPIDTNRDKYRRYIESTGLIEMITKSLVKILDMPESERPENPTELFCEHFGATLHAKSIIESLNGTIDQYKIEVENLQNKLEKERALNRQAKVIVVDKSGDEETNKDVSTTTATVDVDAVADENEAATVVEAECPQNEVISDDIAAKSNGHTTDELSTNDTQEKLPDDNKTTSVVDSSTKDDEIIAAGIEINAEKTVDESNANKSMEKTIAPEKIENESEIQSLDISTSAAAN